MRNIIPSGLDRNEAEIYSQLDPKQLPKHVAIIMDGNGRWAKRRHLPRIAGHKKGVEAVRLVVETAARIHLPALTLYAFSAENFLRRPPAEINFLMKLLYSYLKNELALMQRNNIRLNFIGRIESLPREVQERMAWARQETSSNTGTVLTLALNYGARSELVDAFKAMVHAAANNGGVDHMRIDEETVDRHLYTRNLPELDLVIRTSGEMRLSNFLLWQAAYAEIYVTKTFWPDFSGLDLLESIREFQKRERRYGGLNEPNGDEPGAHSNSHAYSHSQGK
ncbi:MAG TPA: isoprenyl transferase [Candidatus Angelobacter sp.]